MQLLSELEAGGGNKGKQSGRMQLLLTACQPKKGGHFIQAKRPSSVA